MTGRRRLWRWVVAVWVIVVAVAGGVTLWLQDSAEPRRYGWEETSPAPSLSASVSVRNLCPSATPAEDGSVLCFVRNRP